MKLWQKLFPDRRRVKPYCSAIIAAAGSSRRMEGENKLLLDLGGKPVLAHTLLAFNAASGVDEIIIAAGEEFLVKYAELCKLWGVTKPVKVVAGGKTREESVYRAALEANRDAKLIAVQDGARPFATPELIDKVIETARVHFAAAPALPVKDTIKAAANGVVQSTPDRSQLYAVQTPQVFDAELLRAALKSAMDAGAAVTDDCSAVEMLGKAVYLTQGLEENIKITTPWDMVLARAIWEKREG